MAEEPQTTQLSKANAKASWANKSEPGANNYGRVKAYLITYLEASDRDIANALTISVSTENKWRRRIKGAETWGEQEQ